MTIQLPESLRVVPLRVGWQETPVDPHRRTQMDDGQVAVTRKLTRIPVLQSVTWELSAVQLELWRDFWINDLDAGSNWFYALVVDGVRNTLRACRLGGDTPYTAVSNFSGFYEISLQLEIREVASLSASERMVFDAYVLLKGDVDGVASTLASINDRLRSVV